MDKKIKHWDSLINVLILLLVFIGSIFLNKNYPVSGVPVEAYMTTDVVYADGRTAQFDSCRFGRVNRGDTVTVHLRLPQQSPVEQPVLCFYIYHAVTEIRCNGVLVDGYGAALAADGAMIGNTRFCTPLPADACGGEVTIRFQVTEDDAFTRINRPLLYPRQVAYRYYFESDNIGFWVAFPMMVLGLIALLTIALIGRRSKSIRKGLYIALFAILAACWIISSEGMQLLFGWTSYFWTVLEYICIDLIVIPVLLYAFETEPVGTRLHRLLGLDIAVTLCAFLLCTVLHLTNVLHYCRTLALTHFLIVLSGVLLLWFAVSKRRQEHPAARILFSGILLLFAVGLFDVLRYNLFKLFPTLSALPLPNNLPIGLLLFIIYLLRSYISELTAQQRDLVSAQAMADSLTKLFFRIPAGVCVFSLAEDGKIIEANNPFYELIGYNKQEAIRSGFTTLFSGVCPEQRDWLREQYTEMMQTGCVPTHIEFSAIHKDGKRRDLLVSNSFDAESRRFTISAVDITYRKQMEEELRVSEERYRLALSQSGKVFFFFDIPTRTMRLSDELAEAFGLPNEVPNMPENFISRGLVEPPSVPTYQEFYRHIIAGEPSGDTVISCHMRQTPTHIMWYRIAFTSVFDVHGAPASAIITYENIDRQRLSEIENRWKQLDIAAVPTQEYATIDFNLTTNRLLHLTGGLFDPFPPTLDRCDDLHRYICDTLVFAEDRPAYAQFFDRPRLLQLFADGTLEDSLEYRIIRHDESPRWVCATVQLITDPYAGDVLSRSLLRDIHEKKTGEIHLRDDLAKLQQELENSRIKVMINQMQPHFLYNALSAIQTIVKTDPDYAYRLIYDFTVHLRSSIKALSSDAPIPFRDELKNIKAYLNIERMRFGDMLQVHYEIDCEDFSVIPLSIQPLAENAARHGVYPKGEEGGTVTVRTYETVTAYVVEVEDDGVGFDVDEVMHRQTDSVGLKSLSFRLRSLMHADVNVSSHIGKGTKVIVTIPKKED